MKKSRMKNVEQAKILKRLRRGKFVSQMDVSLATGVNATRLCRLESGHAHLTVDECKKLSDFYNYDVYAYIVGEIKQ